MKTKTCIFAILLAAGLISSQAQEPDCHWAGGHLNPQDRLVMHSPAVFAFYWGTYFQDNPAAVALTNNFLTSILDGPFMDGLAQYGIGKGRLLGSAVVQDACPNPLYVDHLEWHLNGWISNGIAPEPDFNTLYVIFAPPGIELPEPNGSGYVPLGYHYWGWWHTLPYFGKATKFFAAIQWPFAPNALSEPVRFVNSVAGIVSHEMAEAFSDRDGNGFVTPDSCRSEIADICDTEVALGSFNVRRYWSDADQTCVPVSDIVPPTVGANQDGRLEIFVRGSDSSHAFLHNWQWAPNGAFNGWTPLGGYRGSAIDRLTVGQNEDGRMELFGRGWDGKVWHNWQWAPNGAFNGWTLLNGAFNGVDWIDLLTVGRNEDERMELFGRGVDGAVLHNWQWAPNGAFTGWTSLGGWIDRLTVGQNEDGRLEIFVRGSDRAIWHNWQTAANSGWSGWTPLGGGCIDMLTVGRNKDGRLEIFYVGVDGQIYHNWQGPNGGWSGEYALGGLAREIAVGANQDGRLELFYVGTNGQIYHNWQLENGNGWSGERAMP